MLYHKGKPCFISHDHGVAFSRENKIIAAIELERYTGVKHDNRLEDSIVEILLKVWDHKEQLRFFEDYQPGRVFAGNCLRWVSMYSVFLNRKIL